MRAPRGIFNFGVGRTRSTIRNVVANAVVEQHRILRHDAKARAHAVLFHVAEILAVDRDAAFLDIVETKQQSRQRRFARAARSHDSNRVPGRHFEAHVKQDLAFWIVAKVDVLKANRRTVNRERFRVWFVGDTGYDTEIFRTIRRRLGSPDLALVPIGAYEPRWLMAPAHMNPAEAVQLHREVGSRQSIGMHWGTFQLTDEGRDEPIAALSAARTANGMSAEELTAWLAEHIGQFKQEVLEERYEATAVKKVEIPKPNGGVRTLGIPTVKDRLLQQAIYQVLNVYYDPHFSDSSYGFRPGRAN